VPQIFPDRSLLAASDPSNDDLFGRCRGQLL
jgi:hypothetical protein